MIKIHDMTHREIKIAIIRAGVTQVELARQNKVNPTMVNRIITGLAISDRVMRSIADAIGIDKKQIWPSVYLYRKPRKPGRPKKEETR